MRRSPKKGLGDPNQLRQPLLARSCLSIALQLALSPTLVFAIEIKHLLDTAIFNQERNPGSRGSRSGHLLFLTGRDCPGRRVRQARFGRRDAASKFCCRFAITGPQFGAFDRPDELAPRRALRLHLHQRLAADLGRCTLGECGCRKADRGENKQNPHRHFPFAIDGLTPSVDGRPSLSRKCATEPGPRSWKLSNVSSEPTRQRSGLPAK